MSIQQRKYLDTVIDAIKEALLFVIKDTTELISNEEDIRTASPFLMKQAMKKTIELSVEKSLWEVLNKARVIEKLNSMTGKNSVFNPITV